MKWFYIDVTLIRFFFKTVITRFLIKTLNIYYIGRQIYFRLNLKFIIFDFHFIFGYIFSA